VYCKNLLGTFRSTSKQYYQYDEMLVVADLFTDSVTLLFLLLYMVVKLMAVIHVSTFKINEEDCY
jgi:hypothetical protein